jgi:abortive infection bacteriophage resistance protein
MAVFTKPAITPIEQLQLLKKRELLILDEHNALCFLNTVSFFRLTPSLQGKEGGRPRSVVPW